MYYIYHIPSVKIGCSTNPKRRVRQQGYTQYDILETHSDIDIASNRELELQKEYGYSVDKKGQIYSNQFSIMGKKANKKGNNIMIENKIGIFGVSIQQRREWAKNAGLIGSKISGENRSKSVLMFDKKGNYIRKFKSRVEAAKFVKGNVPPLVQVIDKPNNSYKGYRWFNETSTSHCK
jgi:hypothetical protein